MKHRNYASMDAAMTYLKDVGDLKYRGRITIEIYLYSLDIPGRPRYLLYIHESGLVELVGETLFRG